MLRLSDIGTESNVLVIGPGPIGLMALALARRRGARRVFAAGLGAQKPRRDLALRFGADDFVDVEKGKLEDHDFGCPIDRILVTAPPSTLPAAIELAAVTGVIVYIGIQYGPGAMCTFDANTFHFKKLQLRGSFASPVQFGPFVQFMPIVQPPGAAVQPGPNVQPNGSIVQAKPNVQPKPNVQARSPAVNSICPVWAAWGMQPSPQSCVA